MQLIIDPRVDKALFKLTKSDQGKVIEYIELFRKYGFSLSQMYLKKISKSVWELRPGRWRVFILVIKPNCYVIHLMRKQSQKMTKETKKIIEQRTKEYI